ncbi:MAG: hypothetical protein H0U35_08490 [Sporichthyaceae bacterium]|nr:hypothetical protein [Sporichthyaceae bacterium]
MTSDASQRSEEGRPEPGSAEDPLVDVVLLRYPLRLGVRSSQHYEEVFREFALLSASAPQAHDSIPVRLLALIDALGRRYARQQAHEEERDAAVRRGETSRDFTISLPASAAEASATLDVMLDETDVFCRDGTLLTLEAPADVVAFRRWYLRQVIDQTAGAAPLPWPGDLR